MWKKRRTPNLRRTLCVEVLENRTLLTGNVTAQEDATGLLSLTGDGNDNAIALTQNNDTVTVFGVNATTVNGQPQQTFPHVTAISIVFPGGNTLLDFDGITTPGIPGAINITEGTGNNTIMMVSTAFQGGTITLGNETTGAMGNNVVNISNDFITGTGSSGNLNVSLLNESGVSGRKLGGGAGNGPGSVNMLAMTSLLFTGGGNLNARVDDSVPFFMQNLFIPSSTVRADNINTAGSFRWTFGDHFESVLLGSHGILNGANQTTSVGADNDMVVVTANIQKRDTVTVGDVTIAPVSIVPSPSVLVSGTTGSGALGDGVVANFGSNANTSLLNGWPIEITQTINGFHLALPGQGSGLAVNTGSGDALTVDPTMVNGDMNIDMGSGGVNGLESLSLLNCTGTDPQIHFNSNVGDIVDITFTNLLITGVGAVLSVQDSGHGADSMTLSDVHVNQGFLAILLSDSGKNIVKAHNVTVLQGFINGGPGIGDTYVNQGGNSGYIVIGFEIFMGPPPP